MRTSDVKIGKTYLCRIGSRLARVIVTARHTSEPNTSGRKRPDVFCVKKVGTTVNLPKHRSASALRPCPEAPPAKPCFFCHEVNGHTTECLQAQREPYADKVAKHLDPPACIVSQEYYLSAAENGVGWCTTCKIFRGENLEPNSREHECPECHQRTLYGAEFALCEGYIDPKEDK